MTERRIFVAMIACAALAACSSLDAHLSPYYTAPGSGATATATATSIATGTNSSSNTCTNGTTPTASVVIDMSALIGAGTSTAGAIMGYADNTLTSIATSDPISVSVGSTVQFFNAESTAVTHSAAGLTSASFPNAYSFASSLMFASGTAITTAGPWSTGYLPMGCVSQVFTVPAAGTYLFGDLTSYASGFRGVIVAQ